MGSSHHHHHHHHLNGSSLVPRGSIKSSGLESNSDAGINLIALPAFSQVDPEVFAALPAELQRELKAAYDQRQ
uniref:DNA repair protein REV1 n=2 Tax=Homo sapiens TaxID=9606 RepID=UPI000DBECEAF|nr:Chain A, DNA repair protein REV1 [Homo sapiens]